jgi:cytochrome c peroxidase
VPQTPSVVPELPIEVETEVGPAGSLKLVPLFKEIAELLENPHAFECPTPDDPATQSDESVECIATTARRPGFGNPMPNLKVFHPCHNVLTGQPLRRRPDGEIDWNQPGFLFDPAEIVAVQPPQPPLNLVSNIPAELRTPIGALVACPAPGLLGDPCRGAPRGSLVVNNPPGNGVRRFYGFGGDGEGPGNSDARIPPHRTVIAKSACNAAGELIDEAGQVVDELEQPVNETHFIKNRRAAEVLGKALFWDMQVGSDGIQACGSCHFHGGVDNRTRNQLNPNTNGGDMALSVRGPGTPQNTNGIDVVPADFPFHKRVNADVVGDGMNPAIVVSDSNDVMSSMGVSRFTQFTDVVVGSNATAFGSPVRGVRPLLPDLGTPVADPVPVMQGNRRIEPRNTPTFHSAAFNFDNFWDGRARHDYNGGSVFGPSDPFFHVHVSCAGALRPLAAPLEAELEPDPRPLCDWTEAGGNYLGATEGEEPVPVRIRFSSLASQAMGPPLSDFEMAFAGRNWPKIGKKLLQGSADPTDNRKVTPLANQLVDPSDSRLGPWSNQGGARCVALGRPTAVRKPGLCTTYQELVQAAFRDELWRHPAARGHFIGTAVPMNAACDPGEQVEEGETPTCDPFDGYVLARAAGPAARLNTNSFNLMEANFSLFFGLAVQAYEQLTIPDDTPWDRFNDANPGLGNGVAQPGEQGTLPPSVIRELVTGSPTGNLVPVRGFGSDELFGFDIFAGGNLTAALPVGSRRNPAGFGSNPFLRTARCMLCHLGPEQSDHTNNVNAGLLQSGTEQEFPFPQNAPEPTGILRLVTGFSLAEELEENAQDGVEVENRNFQSLDTNLTPSDNAVVAPASATAFQDNGIYNIGLRPTGDDILRGGDDPFGFPLSLAALALKNLGGAAFEPCDTETEWLADPSSCSMTVPDPSIPGFGLYDTIGAGVPFPGTTHEQSSINPGLGLEPASPMLPEYLAEWVNNLPAGEANPLIDELAFAPNTVTKTPVAEYGEILFGADQHCGVFDTAAFGSGAPNFGWGPLCPNSQTGVPTNMGLGDPTEYVPGSLVAPMNGTWPFPNRVARDGAAKVPQLRNVELTGPYFHTGSYLTLRQVIDFYMRGGDFPLTNAEDRDPNLVDVNRQAFGFGATEGLDPAFLDGIPDTMSQYGAMPDTDHASTPEPRNATPEQAKEALVSFLLALTDERVAHRRAPFDQPEIFVPIDGTAPENIGGRALLVRLSGAPCAPGSTGPCFQQVPATGRAGQAARLLPFLGISRASTGGPNNDHFDR